MKIRIIATCQAGGVEKIVGSMTSDEVSEEEYIEFRSQVERGISSLGYMTLGDTVIPGDFIRRNCVITLCKE